MGGEERVSCIRGGGCSEKTSNPFFGMMLMFPRIMRFERAGTGGSWLGHFAQSVKLLQKTVCPRG